MGFFSSPNQRYDIIICVYCFELFSQVSDVAHGSLVDLIIVFLINRYRKNIEDWIFMLNLGLYNIVVFFPSTCKTDYANMQKMFTFNLFMSTCTKTVLTRNMIKSQEKTKLYRMLI